MAFRETGNPPKLFTQGKQTNPADQAVMADTGAISNSALSQVANRLIEFRICLGASAAAVWTVQHRNAANAANVAPSPYTFYTAGGQSAEFVIALKLAPGERVRVVSDGGFTGTGAATIQAEDLS